MATIGAFCLRVDKKDRTNPVSIVVTFPQLKNARGNRRPYKIQHQHNGSRTHRLPLLGGVPSTTDTPTHHREKHQRMHHHLVVLPAGLDNLDTRSHRGRVPIACAERLRSSARQTSTARSGRKKLEAPRPRNAGADCVRGTVRSAVHTRAEHRTISHSPRGHTR